MLCPFPCKLPLRDPNYTMSAVFRAQETHNTSSVQNLNYIRLGRNVMTYRSFRHVGLHGDYRLRGYRFPAQDSNTVRPSHTNFEQLSAEAGPRPKIRSSCISGISQIINQYGTEQRSRLGDFKDNTSSDSNYTFSMLASTTAQDYSKTL